jgi:hypothetical protein
VQEGAVAATKAPALAASSRLSFSDDADDPGGSASSSAAGGQLRVPVLQRPFEFLDEGLARTQASR